VEFKRRDAGQKDIIPSAGVVEMVQAVLGALRADLNRGVAPVPFPDEEPVAGAPGTGIQEEGQS
jgi:hypothetical protein